MARPQSIPKTSLTVVIKLGTSSIVHETTHQPLLSILSAVVETVVKLRQHGHKVVLVSSGAIGVGLKRMEMPVRPKTLAGKQALAAIGQGRLIALWDNLFSQLGQPIAQVLITRGDIADRTRYLNAVNTLAELLSMGVVPIINENDTISVSEIKFGDNDTLSAITSSMLHADYLFLLTDVDSLYTSNPRKDPLAKAIEVVSSIPAIRSQVSTATLGSNLGTGGMETKLIAAEIATSAGVSTIITSSRNPSAIFDIIEYSTSSLASTPTASVGIPDPINPVPLLTNTTTPVLPATTEPTSATNDQKRSIPSSSAIDTPIRPPHTLFLPSVNPLRDLKSWTSHTLAPAGDVVIDTGAHRVLSKRESGGRLLPAGVIGVVGTFASGQAVRICIRKRSSQASASLDHASGSQTPLAQMSALDNSVPYVEFDAHISLTSTPTAKQDRTLSLKDVEAVASSLTAIAVAQRGLEEAIGEQKDADSQQDEGWTYVEVGRGLANYNSAEIQKIKGCKSSQVANLLGYADSEYVVENIAIRVLPEQS